MFCWQEAVLADCDYEYSHVRHISHVHHARDIMLHIRHERLTTAEPLPIHQSNNGQVNDILNKPINSLNTN